MVTGSELDAAFVAIAQQQITALLVASDSLFFDRRERLVALVARQSIPAIYYLRAFPQAWVEHSQRRPSGQFGGDTAEVPAKLLALADEVIE